MPPAAILDIDGTLVDTNYHHAIAWYRAFRRHHITLPIWRIHRHIGMGGDQLIAAVAGSGAEEQQGDSIRAAQGEEYGTLIGETAPFEGAKGEPLSPPSPSSRAGSPSRSSSDAGAVEVFDSIQTLDRHLDQTPLK